MRILLTALLWSLSLSLGEQSADVCAHISYEDVAFMANYLRAEGLDVTPIGWPAAKRRLLNYDAARCVNSSELDEQAERKPAGRRQRSARLARKVFGVGLSKTGTTSLHNALLQVGLANADMASDYWHKVVDQLDARDAAAFFDPAANARGSRHAEVAVLSRRFFQRYSGGTDLPTAIFYEEHLATFPDALFVLTVREQVDWSRSAFSQFTRKSSSSALRLNRVTAFGAVEFEPHLYRKRYLEHNADVLRTVPCCQLLVMDVFRGQGWERLAPSIERPESLETSPPLAFAQAAYASP